MASPINEFNYTQQQLLLKHQLGWLNRKRSHCCQFTHRILALVDAMEAQHGRDGSKSPNWEAYVLRLHEGGKGRLPPIKCWSTWGGFFPVVVVDEYLTS